MVKEKRTFLWQTALSILDVGTSLVYYLLGRDLDQTDILILEEIFKHMSLQITDTTLDVNNSDRLIRSLEKVNKGKDILLVTSNTNGYNVLQSSIANVLIQSANILNESQMNRETQIQSVKARIRLIEALLVYGCDPNRGLVLANKKKFTLTKDNVLSVKPIENFPVPKKCEIGSDIDKNESMKNKKHPVPEYNDSDSSDSIMPTDMRNVSLNPVTADNLNVLNATPIDTPLLLVCSVYNCHNLLSLCRRQGTEGLRRKNPSVKSMSPPFIISEILSNEQQMQDTCDMKLLNAKLRRERAKTPREETEKLTNSHPASSNAHTLTSSSQSLLLNSSQSSASFVYGYSSPSESSLKADLIEHDQNVTITPRRPLLGGSLEKERIDDVTDQSLAIDMTMDKDELVQVEFTSSSSSGSESCEEEDKLKELDYLQSNIYNYENDDMAHYDRYEYDVDSMCCKIPMQDEHPLESAHYVNKTCVAKDSKTVLLDSSGTCCLPLIVKELVKVNSMNSLASIHGSSITKTTPTKLRPSSHTYPHKLNSKLRHTYETLNNQRLELIDLLLKHNADKYLNAKLSSANYKLLSKKSQNTLRKWYEIPGKYPVSKRLNNVNNVDLRPISPLMISLCLDDVEVFSRLYKHRQAINRYFKPNEDLELIYHAIRFQSEYCLIYLISNTNNLHISNSKEDSNINTMFYILENTRSPKIISVLIKCGFDLTKNDTFTGSTALHCLFNQKNITRFDPLKSNGINSSEKGISQSNEFLERLKSHKSLDEFPVPSNLSKILFTMLKYCGMKPFVNTMNHEHKVCMQLLFEWPELVETVCFVKSDKRAGEWKTEMDECVGLLLKSGADIFLNLPERKNTTQSYNCVDTLIKSILTASERLQNSKKPLRFSHHTTEERSKLRSAALTAENSSVVSEETETKLLEKKTRHMHQLRRVHLKSQSDCKLHLDTKFILHLLGETLGLKTLEKSGIKKRNTYSRSYTQKSYQSSQVFGLADEDSRFYNSLIGSYLQILMNSYVDDFENAFNILKLLCKFEALLAIMSGKLVSLVDPNLIKKFINQWVLQANFLSSSKQFEKNYFVKSCLVHLITQKLCDPNDCFTYHNEHNVLVSNNLLNHCMHMVSICKSGYQLELVYDLTRTLLQYGADPNLDPYELSGASSHSAHAISMTSNQIRAGQFKGLQCPTFVDPQCSHTPLKRGMSILTRLCKSVKMPNLQAQNVDSIIGQTKAINSLPHAQPHTPQIYNEPDFSSLSNHMQPEQNTQDYINFSKPPHSSLSGTNNYFNDYFNDRYFSSHYEIAYHDLNQKSGSNSPILLLTPTPSYESCIMLVAGTYHCHPTNNIIINSSVLLLGYYKNFIKLMYDAMDSYSIQKCLEYKTKMTYAHHHSKKSQHSPNHKHQYRLYHNSHLHHRHRNHESVVNPIEPLGEYLQHLASTPRTLKSITRRHIIGCLTQVEEFNDNASMDSNEAAKSNVIATQIHKLDLPVKLKDFMLFIE